MSKNRLILVLILTILLLGLIAGIFGLKNPHLFKKFAAENPLIPTKTTQLTLFTPLEIIVSYKEPLNAGSFQALQEQADILSISTLDFKSFLANVFLLKLSQDVDVAEKIKELSSDPTVAFAEPNYVFLPLLTPNDAYFPQQWDLKKIAAEPAWDLSTGKNTVKIALLDTGVNLGHPDLANKVFGDGNLISDHGTKTAGAIAAQTNNNEGIASVGFGQIQLESINVCTTPSTCPASLIAQGIDRAVTNQNKVINIGLGSKSDSQLVKSAIQQAIASGCLIIAGAGNDGDVSYRYPAAYSEVLAVAASDENDNRASFSQYGNWVDVAAPGTKILTTLPGSIYGQTEGTSAASALVSSLAGLLFSTKPGLSAYQVARIIETSAEPVSYVLWGRINAEKALAQIVPLTPTPTFSLSPTPPLTPTPTPEPTPTLTPTPLLTPGPTPPPPFVPPGCEGKNPLTDPYCALYEVIKLATIFMRHGIYFALLFFTLAFILGAFQYITAGDDPKKLTQARATFSWAVIGLIVVSSAYGIIKLIFQALGGKL